ncbi:alanine aminotransferase 2-like [Hermetia illucens]|uniref:alanine aminotransferase 2-like n=1 Tax=Hermetia illucens TaxID=343691 RepID=UPI0018CC1DC0|nr:alanine aminotransferase 2-like [Hermetia illucens]
MSELHPSAISINTINPNVKLMEYAVRGPLVIRAAEIEEELKHGVRKPFDEVIRANTGDCQAMGQAPITYIRQVLSLALRPELLEVVNCPSDIKERVRTLLNGCNGGSLGSYTGSLGIEFIRRYVQQFLGERDDVPSDYRDIILTTGATQGIKSILQLLKYERWKSNLFQIKISIFKTTAVPLVIKKTGIMVSVPQYPMYSATIVEQGMHLVSYFLEEETNWGLNINELKRAIDEAKEVCIPRAIVIINPGNPTGQILTRANMEEIIKFAYEENLVILADEVYQNNVYEDRIKFNSFKKVLVEMGEPYKNMALASFMSCSKGYTGECGLRGGLVEIFNFPADVKTMFYKSLSAQVCPNTVSQAAIFCLVNPPREGEPSYELFMEEKTKVLKSLKERAQLVHEVFNSFEGFSCTTIQGAMYAFPQFKLPPKVIELANERGMPPDQFYAFELLENTGVCIVPGSGFGQKPGTYHFRTTILPKIDKLKVMLEKIKSFHTDFIAKYR